MTYGRRSTRPADNKPRKLMCLCGAMFVTRHAYNEHVKGCHAVRVAADLEKRTERGES